MRWWELFAIYIVVIVIFSIVVGKLIKRGSVTFKILPPSKEEQELSRRDHLREQDHGPRYDADDDS